MSIIEKAKSLVGVAASEPNTFHCADCDRTFEVDAPPNRVVCMNCGNDDVDLMPE